MAEKGLGTPATRAATIEKLLGEEYMTREKRILMPTAKAFKLKELLIRLKAELLLSPELTGDWEAKLKSIEVGQGKGSDFLDGIKSLTLDIVSRGLQMPPAATCSACGKPMIRRKGPNGLFWGCTGYPGCKAALPDDNGKPGAAR
ncbi:DNA topoisomerase, partial [Staphylococcus gallinarum]